MNMDSAKPDNNDEPREESLQERSARLEAEALARAQEQDALSPEPLPEDDDIHTFYDADSEETPGMDDFQAVVETLRTELAQTKDQAMRALAEAENTRQRAKKEREDASKFAISGFARDLLDVADNLRRALEAVPADLVEADVRVKNLLDGIEGTERQLLRSFEKNGIQKIDPLDEPFDPNFHEVMFEGPAPDKAPGTVIQVLEIGYVINDRLLRPARVGVAKAGDQGGEGPSHPGDHIDTEA